MVDTDLKQPEDDFQRPSKTQQKRESAAIQAMAVELAELPAVQLQQLALPDKIRHLVNETRGMGPGGARKRLLKYIGGQLREMNIELIVEELARMKNQNKHASRELHKLEHWRDQLITEGDSALTALVNEYPDADLQYIRQLIRNARKEQQMDKPPKSSRMLFKCLRSLVHA